jgi:hypothetical protein
MVTDFSEEFEIWDSHGGVDVGLLGWDALQIKISKKHLPTSPHCITTQKTNIDISEESIASIFRANIADINVVAHSAP